MEGLLTGEDMNELQAEFAEFTPTIAQVLGDRWAQTLEKRGWNPDAYASALQSQDEDEITLANPYNWMTEQEVEKIVFRSYNRV
jgi:hypothetical protein